VKRKPKPLAPLHQEILAALQESPEGLDIEEIRQRAKFQGAQEELTRRVRELRPFYDVPCVRDGGRYVYRLRGERPEGEWEFGEISSTQRARILGHAAGRCQMCGRTVKEDGVKLQVDHKVPQSWGGSSEDDNLWALCSDCNGGKKNYYASFESGLMRKILTHKSVHRRIAELLRSKQGEWVECDLIEFVASFDSSQTDWRKRLRELRYMGLTVEVRRRKAQKRNISEYRLTNWAELPDDPSAFTREYERRRALRNRARGRKG